MPPKLPSSRGKPFQSKLSPVTGVIAALRQQRRTYADISRILREQHGISASPSTIFNFIKVRSRKRHLFQLAEIAYPSSVPVPVPHVQLSGTSNSSAEAIERLKRSKPAEPPRKLFTFDENKPLTLKP